METPSQVNSPPPKRYWSPEEEDQLRQLLLEKTKIPEIKKLLGRTEKSIRRKCEQLGISSSVRIQKN